MSLDDAVRQALLGGVPELVATLRTDLKRPQLLPIKRTPVAYRLILAAERAGELTVYRVGNASTVDEHEFFAWIRRTGKPAPPPPVEEPTDEIGEIIAMDERRRARRKASK